MIHRHPTDQFASWTGPKINVENASKIVCCEGHEISISRRVLLFDPLSTEVLKRGNSANGSPFFHVRRAKVGGWTVPVRNGAF